jgi:hypothetical protein
VEVGGDYEADEVFTLLPGPGMLVNFHPTLHNILPSVSLTEDKDEDGDSLLASASTGAFIRRIIIVPSPPRRPLKQDKSYLRPLEMNGTPVINNNKNKVVVMVVMVATTTITTITRTILCQCH